MRKLNLQNQKFGKLTVLTQDEQPGAKVKWICLCECGRFCKVVSNKLTSGYTKSCGCLRVKHGHSYNISPEYSSWRSMKDRCSNPKASGFERYGGRGIKVCVRWADFQNFLTDMGKKPTSRHTIDRINRNGNYEPGNCRWATPKEQSAWRVGQKASIETRKKMSLAHQRWWKEFAKLKPVAAGRYG